MDDLRFAVNCSILFQERPLLERPAAARRAGFDAIELWWPVAGPTPSSAEIRDLIDAIGASGIAGPILRVPIAAGKFQGVIA